MTEKTNAMRLFDRHGIHYEAVAFSPDIHSAEGVAEALGLSPGEVFKTLVIVRPPRKPVLVILAGNGEFDLGRTAAAIGEKRLAIASLREAEAPTGLPVGGISGLAIPEKGFDVCLDRVALSHDKVLVIAGRRGLNLVLRTEDLVRATGASVIDDARRE